MDTITFSTPLTQHICLILNGNLLNLPTNVLEIYYLLCDETYTLSSGIELINENQSLILISLLSFLNQVAEKKPARILNAK